uniref:Uncharacterized protein n=1 Tax=Solanum lycopersicum TaxID=4081 RepID=A0A3Q7JAZ3_SOLLC
MLEGAKSMGAGAATIALAGAAIGIGNVLSSSIHSVAQKGPLVYLSIESNWPKVCVRLKNKRIRFVADLLQDQFGLALVRLENVVRGTKYCIFRIVTLPRHISY